MIQARVEKKDPQAICDLGEQYAQGFLGLQKDMIKAVELFTEAAELGSVPALFNLGRIILVRGFNRTRQMPFIST